MKYLNRNRTYHSDNQKPGDPMDGVANLFDVALVFIVALLLSLMSAYQVLDFFNPESEITIMKKNEGQWQIITKKEKRLKQERLQTKRWGGMKEPNLVLLIS